MPPFGGPPGLANVGPSTDLSTYLLAPMISTLLGKKLGMTQVYDAQNVLVPVTVVEAGPCAVVQVKTTAIDGYNAVQLGFSTKKPKNTSKAELAHAKAAGLESRPARSGRSPA